MDSSAPAAAYNYRIILFYQLTVIIGGSALALDMMTPCSSINRMANFKFCNLTRMPLVSSDTLKLDLSFNYVSEINRTFFPKLYRLVDLNLGSQKTNRLIVKKDSFRNTPNLVKLDLATNQLLILDPEGLAGLSQLKILFLYYNKLNGSILENDYFKDLTSLEYVDLSSNEIAYLKPNPLFYHLYSLSILILRYNHISSICAGDLHSFEMKNFTFMDLSDNYFYNWETLGSDRCGNPFRNIRFDTLLLSGNRFGVSQMQKFSSALNGTKIIQLKLCHHIMGPGFGYNNFKDPDNRTFVGLVNSDLEILDLSKGSIFSMQPYTYGNLTILKVLNLAENKINRIEKDAFYGLNSLINLNLAHNLLGELYDYSFNSLTVVTVIDLEQNHIGAIQINTFKSLSELNTLNLRGNSMKTITFFESPVSIGYIFVGGNKLKSIDSSFVYSNFLDLSENDLRDLGGLYKLLQYPLLQYVILKRNRLSVCYPHFNISKNNSLLHLDLSDNMISLIWDNGQCGNIFSNLSLLGVLKLNNNLLRYLPNGIFNGLDSLQTLNLSSNLLTYLIPGIFPTNLDTVDLSKNQLYSPNPKLFLSVKTLDLTDNHYICDCDLVYFLRWLNETNATLLGSPNDIYCMYPTNLLYKPLHVLEEGDCDESEALTTLMFSLFVLNATIILIGMSTVVTYTHYRGFCFVMYKRIISFIIDTEKQEEAADTCKYDAYLCYSGKDFQWVQDAFLQNLDTQYSDRNRFHFCFEERDFVPGEDHIVNIRDAIWNSKKTICVVTKQFLKDGWCVEALNYAQSRYFTDLKDVLIMVVVGSLSQYQLMKYQPIRAYVKRCQYLKWPEDIQDVEWFLGRLSYQILKENKVEKKLKKSSNHELQTIETIS
ncbi:toll like receptor 5 L homeolog [Xenopus laevis]|uniref:LOC495313 protein n=3 Tax=Xenopus laevis TaxID=8355 RepID=Q5U5B1_XENLA|nr:toll like receptor 5 L homeolog [Xenopus laevis]AAH84773.1 LOC495313 protein [Xenopus laevis]OCT79449.1 hypothetical protein XELAEV_18026259mg [Xenopus laevis]